jgi:hypothetical protein
MQDAPEGGEVGVAVLVVAEDGFEVELEEVRPREGIGIAQEAARILPLVTMAHRQLGEALRNS